LHCRSHGSEVQQREKLIRAGPVQVDLKLVNRNNYVFIKLTTWYYQATFIAPMA
jgi:hypothetical protein